MSKKRTGAKRFWDGVFAVLLGILGVATLVFAGLGIWKTVELVKDYKNKDAAAEAECLETAGADVGTICLEEQIANDMVA